MRSRRGRVNGRGRMRFVLFTGAQAAYRHNLSVPVGVVIEDERRPSYTRSRRRKMESDSTRRVRRQGRTARVTSDGEILNIAAGELNAREMDRLSARIVQVSHIRSTRVANGARGKLPRQT